MLCQDANVTRAMKSIYTCKSGEASGFDYASSRIESGESGCNLKARELEKRLRRVEN